MVVLDYCANGPEFVYYRRNRVPSLRIFSSGLHKAKKSAKWGKTFPLKPKDTLRSSELDKIKRAWEPFTLLE